MVANLKGLAKNLILFFHAGLIIQSHALGAWLEYETVALSGQPNAHGITFSGLASPRIAADGEVVFQAVINGASTTNDFSIWSYKNGVQSLIVREGDGVPGGSIFFAVDTPRIGENGQVAFGAGIRASNGSTTGSIWARQNGLLNLVARQGAIPTGASPSLAMQQIGGVSATGSNVAFMEGDININSNVRIWSGLPGGLRLVAAELTPAAGIGGGVLLNELTPFNTSSRFSVNASGDVAYRGTLSGTGVNATNDVAVWKWHDGSSTLVARTGDLAPGSDAGDRFSRLENPVINNNGAVAFAGRVINPASGSSQPMGIWAGRGGALELVARAGQAAPGTTDRAFSSFQNPVIGGGDDIAFVASLAVPSGGLSSVFGLWVGQPGDLRLVARTGDHLPGTDPQLELRDFNFGSNSQNAPAINVHGDVMFQALLTENGSDVFDSGIWAFAQGELFKLALTGDLFDVDPDPLVQDLRMITHAGMTRDGGGEDGRPTGFNDNRVGVLHLYFSDGTDGIFSVSIVPEPSTWALAIVGLLGLLVNAVSRIPRSRPLAETHALQKTPVSLGMK
ncbi:MAG: choice-of-anchor tandem repeat NxxGxxAF-containing protein [Pirellulales bacterium]